VSDTGELRPSQSDRWSFAWLLTLAVCAASLTLVETYLIGRSTDLFTGGYKVVDALRSGGRFGLYLLGSFAFDTALVLGIWAFSMPLLRMLRLDGRQLLATSGLLGLGLPLTLVYVRFQLSRFLGDLLDVRLLLTLAGGSPLEWISQARSQLAVLGGAVGAVLMLGGLLIRALRGAAGSEHALAPPSGRRMTNALGAAFALSTAVFVGFFLRAGAGLDALEMKVSGFALTQLFGGLTDFDFDGFGMVSWPIDQAPFDPSRHPYALDQPGNGIDENGLAGDLPAGYRRPPDEFVEHPVFKQRPNVLFIFLEGVRADVLFRKLGEREITPFLNALAITGSSSQHAYANSPYTARSRVEVMGGRLAPFVGQTSLIDDFHGNGYEVAWFSGQDESFGKRDSEILGLKRVDVYFDARDEIEHTVSNYRTSGSVLLSWKRLNARIGQFLDGWAGAKPLFMYVNYGDTHYPYDHRELDDLLGVPRLSRLHIQPDDPEGVFATYANATANVDRAIEQLVSLWREKLGPNAAIIVTSDHGEALFEAGVLGHGLALDDTQTHVPLVVDGLGGVWPEPFGHTDLRAALQRALLLEPGSPARPRFQPVPGRHILQYMALIEAPRLLCLRGQTDALHLDTARPRAPDGPELQELVWWWESLQLENAARYVRRE
jgi:hypothetical protein